MMAGVMARAQRRLLMLLMARLVVAMPVVAMPVVTRLTYMASLSRWLAQRCATSSASSVAAMRTAMRTAVRTAVILLATAAA